MSMPNAYELVREIHSSEVHLLVEARREGQRYALRILKPTYEAVLDPAALITRFGEIQNGLQLRHLAEFASAGPHEDGFYIAERWVSGRPLSGASWSEIRDEVALLLDDLGRLHSARKWHGGIRAGRLLWSDGALRLTGYTFASWLSTSLRAQRDQLEPGLAVAPELAQGARGAGTALDVYGLSKTLLAEVCGLSPKLKKTLESGLSSDLAARPRIRDLRALCS